MIVVWHEVPGIAPPWVPVPQGLDDRGLARSAWNRALAWMPSRRDWKRVAWHEVPGIGRPWMPSRRDWMIVAWLEVPGTGPRWIPSRRDGVISYSQRYFSLKLISCFFKILKYSSWNVRVR